MAQSSVRASVFMLGLLFGCLPDLDERAKHSGVLQQDTGWDGVDDTSSSHGEESLAIVSITPAYGTSAGGTLVLIRGGPFDSTVDITFGGVRGTVANVVSETEMRVLTPATAQQGLVDVEITTTGGRGTLAEGFQYFLDGTGAMGTLGVLSWQHFLGDYWTNAVDQGSAWWTLVSPPDSRSIPEIFYSASVDTCASNYSINGFYVDDIGVANTTLRVNNRAIQLNWDASQSVWSKSLDIGDFVQSAGYDLDELPAGNYPAFSVENFIRTPSTFLLESPNLNTLGYLQQSDLNFQWSQATADEILLRLVRMQDNGSTTSIAEEVTCRISNNNTSGQFTVPPSVWSGWGNSNQDGSYLEIRVGAITYAAGSLPFNNSRTGVVGGYWVVGASLMQ